MPHRRSSRPLLAGVALATLLLAACGTSPEEETASTTTEVTAAAGSGFCLTWTRYQTMVGGWLLEPPETLEEAVTTASSGLRAAEEARSEAPEDLEADLDEIVSALEAAEKAVSEAESLPDAMAEVVRTFQNTDLAVATTAAENWVATAC